MLADPALLVIDPATGHIAGRTGGKRSRIADLGGIFADADAFAALAAARGDDTAYEVHEHRPAREAVQELICGTSILQPGKVGTEFFMTRGHLHARADRPEIYVCQSGRGVMHMEAPDGTTRPAAMAAGAVVYVPPFWLHRSVNTGDAPFITFFCYPADAGQDYGIVARAYGFRTLIVDDGAGGWTEAPNPRYRPRDAEAQRRCFAAA